MFPYSLNCRKNTESKSLKVAQTKTGRIMILSNYVVRNSKKSKSIKEQEASGFVSCLETTTPLNKSHLLGPLLF